MSRGSQYIKDYTHCPFASKSNIIDCDIVIKEFDTETLEYIKSDFGSIVKTPDFIKSDGYIISINKTINSIAELASSFKTLMCYLNDGSISLKIEDDNWRFTFGDEIFFVIVMSSIYKPNSTRWVPEGHYILFQPEHSFHKYIPRESREVVSRSIRKVFSKHGCNYETIITNAIESQKYIFPLNQDDQLISWWTDH